MSTPPTENWFTKSRADDTFEVTPPDGRDGFCFELNQPWAGSTDAGFGQSLCEWLTVEEAIDLASWILAVVQNRK